MKEEIQRVKIGKIGETIAAELLISSGYILISRNERIGKDEIDIIAKKGDWFVFVEVKTRTGLYMMPEESVDERKQNALTRFAEKYLAMHQLDVNIRFDIISVLLLQGEEPIVRHIENAF